MVGTRSPLEAFATRDDRVKRRHKSRGIDPDGQAFFESVANNRTAPVDLCAVKRVDVRSSRRTAVERESMF